MSAFPLDCVPSLRRPAGSGCTDVDAGETATLKFFKRAGDLIGSDVAA